MNYEVYVNDMKLKHINNSISVIYKRQDVLKNFDVGIGVGLMFSDMQELSVNVNRIDIVTRYWEDFIVPVVLNYNIIENNNLTFGAEVRTVVVPIYPSLENIMFTPYLNVKLF